MIILVTGGAGYIGSVVTERLLKQGHRVVILDNLVTGHKAALHPEAEFVLGDVRDRICLDLVFSNYSIDAVIHMAAKALIPESITDPAPFYATNLVGGITLADAMVAHGVKKFIISSTAAVYGEPQYLPLDENHPTRPMNPYGDSKLSFENLLHWYANAYGLEVTAFRYFSAAGASENYGEAHVPETHLLPRVLQAAIIGEAVEIYGNDYDTLDGTCIRDFIHVIDLADAHIRALEVPSPDGFRVFNLGSGCGYSVLQVIDAAEAVTGKKLKRTFLPRRTGDPAKLIASSEKAMRELNWQPKLQSLPEILESAWKWHLAHPNGYDDGGK
ncbi:MAG: UDP-glucose 4-epimerase GalE [Anaerolinea sp.]|nr:UDP-glucose 4-epimerase GalE [Anaerolinea sp.]